MFLLDDLLMGPGKGALLVFKELARKAREDWLDDAGVKQELQEIYMLVEAGKISSQDFEARECRLLERLEQIARARFNDKWGQPEDAPLTIDASPVIEAMTMSAPLSIPEPLLVMEPPPATETPPAIDPRPAVEARPVIGPPPSVAPVPPTPAAAAPSKPLSINQVIECTASALRLLNLKLSVITSVAPEDGGWRVAAELVERRAVPDTNDLLGVYELHLDVEGAVMRYERTHLRRRGDLGR